MQQPGWFFQELWWVKKLIPESYILHDSIYITLFKWQNYRNGEHINVCHRLRRKWLWEEGGGGYKKQQEGSLWWWKSSVSWLYHCQYADCDSVLWFCKMLFEVEGSCIKCTLVLCMIFYNCMCIYKYLKIKC